jgi:hypothetical protein
VTAAALVRRGEVNQTFWVIRIKRYTAFEGGKCFGFVSEPCVRFGNLWTGFRTVAAECDELLPPANFFLRMIEAVFNEREPIREERFPRMRLE